MKRRATLFSQLCDLRPGDHIIIWRDQLDIPPRQSRIHEDNPGHLYEAEVCSKAVDPPIPGVSTIHLKIEEFHRIWLKPCDPARFFLVVEPAPERDYAYVRFADLEVGDRILYGGDYDEEMKQEIQVLRPRTILEIREQAAEAGQPERELILLAQNGKIYTFDFYANQRVYTALK